MKPTLKDESFSKKSIPNLLLAPYSLLPATCYLLPATYAYTAWLRYDFELTKAKQLAFA
ncbi:hypothetical protein [Sulfurovum mangrovi]|uniref:hypothetical protein n=1 Tax=Sulfurovum mangrovi TaxID=2893889 RepID=UPI001E46EF50|nr:hypothetical protein [Sulfurovum mangrovi]UFH59097.1 hypothetical protein LN246_12235 [Sulfurovum mangrovi]